MTPHLFDLPMLADFLRQHGPVIAGVVTPMLIVAFWGATESGRDMNE